MYVCEIARVGEREKKEREKGKNISTNNSSFVLMIDEPLEMGVSKES